MSEHTREPWNIRRGTPWIIDDAMARMIATMSDCSLADDAESNARRIVACVNACRGLSTEQLECVDQPGSNIQLLIEGFPTEDKL